VRKEEKGREEGRSEKGLIEGSGRTKQGRDCGDALLVCATKASDYRYAFFQLIVATSSGRTHKAHAPARVSRFVHEHI
jgi:hypothetical protein